MIETLQHSANTLKLRITQGSGVHDIVKQMSDWRNKKGRTVWVQLFGLKEFQAMDLIKQAYGQGVY